LIDSMPSRREIKALFRRGQTHLCQKAWCAVCQSVGVIAAGSGISDYLRGWDGRLNAMEAVGGDIVLCKCEQPPRIMSVYARCCEYMDASTSSTARSFASNALASATLAQWQEEVIVRWKVRNKKTGKIVDGGERGRYDSVWVSTAAHGSTVFWQHNPTT
jgi:hypothetical protein